MLKNKNNNTNETTSSSSDIETSINDLVNTPEIAGNEATSDASEVPIAESGHESEPFEFDPTVFDSDFFNFILKELDENNDKPHVRQKNKNLGLNQESQIDIETHTTPFSTIASDDTFLRYLNILLKKFFTPAYGFTEASSDIIGFSNFIAIFIKTMKAALNNKANHHDFIDGFSLAETAGILTVSTVIALAVSFAKSIQNHTDTTEAHNAELEMRSAASTLAPQLVSSSSIDLESDDLEESISMNSRNESGVNVKTTVNYVWSLLILLGIAMELSSPTITLLQSLPETENLSPSINLTCQLAALLVAALPALAETTSIHMVLKAYLSDQKAKTPAWLSSIQYLASILKTTMDFISNSLYIHSLYHALIKNTESLVDNVVNLSTALCLSTYAAIPNGIAELKLLNPEKAQLEKKDSGSLSTLFLGLFTSGIYLQGIFSLSQNFVSTILLAKLPIIFIVPILIMAAIASISPTVKRAQVIEQTATTLSDKCQGFFAFDSNKKYQAPISMNAQDDVDTSVIIYDFGSGSDPDSFSDFEADLVPTANVGFNFNLEPDSSFSLG